MTTSRSGSAFKVYRELSDCRLEVFGATTPPSTTHENSKRSSEQNITRSPTNPTSEPTIRYVLLLESRDETLFPNDFLRHRSTHTAELCMAKRFLKQNFNSLFNQVEKIEKEKEIKWEREPYIVYHPDYRFVFVFSCVQIRIHLSQVTHNSIFVIITKTRTHTHIGCIAVCSWNKITLINQQ